MRTRPVTELACVSVFWCSVCLLLPKQVAGVDFCTELPIKHNFTQRQYTIATILDTNNAASRQITRLTLDFLNSSMQEAFDPPIYINGLSADNNNALATVFSHNLLVVGSR
jgi:hypothetical protein